jgi:hypothetical protein
MPLILGFQTNLYGKDIMVQVQQMYYTWLTPKGYGALWIRVSAPEAANSLWFQQHFAGS